MGLCLICWETVIYGCTSRCFYDKKRCVDELTYIVFTEIVLSVKTIRKIVIYLLCLL